jgi:sarcosine oxidase, subunit alpha
MLDESGVIVDDGVIARLDPEVYYFTTTTGGSATVFRELLRLNALWGLDCALVNVTGHRAAFNFAGPASREILQKLTDIDLRDEAFPYLAVRSGQVAGVAARLLRVGFVGELGYEIHVAAGGGLEAWRALYAAGLPRGLRPFGVEAQRVLRLEKGHLIVGQDTDGLTRGFSAGLDWAIKLDKTDFVGKPELAWQNADGGGLRLVGLQTEDPAVVPAEASQIVEGQRIVGRITSSRMSPTLGRSVCLAQVEPRLSAPGTQVTVRLPAGQLITARVCEHLAHVDPEGSRMRV